MTIPRIAPAPADLIRPILAPLFDQEVDPELPGAHLATMPVPNALATIGNNPALLTVLAPLFGALVLGKLPVRDRELVVLSVAHRTHAAYEWAHHVLIGTQAGLTAADIDRIPLGPDAPDWTPHESALLRAVDELSADRILSEETWRQLATTYNQEQLLELLTLIGTYTMVAYILNSCGVQLDSWVPIPS
ncbi:carboxymuconolactone decarboxylase family protein [Nocardia panacis]|uniref:Carboxymuconolactone decarboxylase family protein n=1 Tax=Nocardia panacis TaxID=2340916 RepID=A0A3A4KD69_9NOCA|nr:carboxymuconolactone decarboxylase family protein [Nocardia panacis]RJO70805.1 carboxymuconolactone decarboxylase family protein [Nocardia panacis]